MPLIKTPQEIEKLHAGGQILARVLRELAAMVRPGISTHDLEKAAREKIKEAGASPAFLGYRSSQKGPPFPAALCTSVNNEVVHCVPKEETILRDGDVLSLDLGVKYENLFTDAALTVGVGRVSAETTRLIAATEEALSEGVAKIKPGNHIGDIAAAVEKVGKREKLGIIRDLVGHGVGHTIHEPPSVPNYGRGGTLEKLEPGMVLAIEPMFTLGDWRIKFLPDGWSVVTADGSLAAHFEHTVAVTDTGFEILTAKK